MAKKTKVPAKTKPAVVKEPAHDPQEAHEQQMQGDSDPGDESEGSEINAQDQLKSVDQQGEAVTQDSEIEPSDDPGARMLVRMGKIGDKPYMVGNGHPVKAGMVLRMRPNDVIQHRKCGVPLLVIQEDEVSNSDDVYETDVYDEAYVNPEHEEA